LKADTRAKYQAVLDVVTNLQAAGVDQLGLLTEQMQDVRRPNPADPNQKKSPSGD